MSKISFKQVIKSIDGEPFTNENDEKLTLKYFAINALSGHAPGTQLSGQEKVERFNLALKIEKSKNEVDLTAEETVLIKTAINQFFPSPVIVGRCWELLEKGK